MNAVVDHPLEALEQALNAERRNSAIALKGDLAKQPPGTLGAFLLSPS